MTPARMSYEACAKAAAAAHRRARKAPRPEPTRRARGDLGYKGTEHSRLTLDWTATRVPADEEIRYALGRLRSRARELSRNNAYVRQFLNLLRWNVVGPTGFKLQAQVKNNDGQPAERINQSLEEGWSEFCTDCTADGRQDFVELSQLSIETVAKEGEAFIRLHRGYGRHGLWLEAVDPDRVNEERNSPPTARDPEIRMGVEVNNFGRPVAYYIWNVPPGMTGTVAETYLERVPADQIIHLYKMDRPNQTRGVTWLAPVLYDLRMLGGYEEAELVGARLAASAMGFFTRKDDGGPRPATDEDGRLEIEANPGTFAFAPEGYELSTWEPQRPNPNARDFIKAMLRKISSGLGASYNIMANDLEGVNYSSMRSGLLSERDLWRALQHWMTRTLVTRVYNEWVSMSLLTGALVLDTRAPRRFQAARWIPRGWAWVDPAKDTAAGIQEIQHGLGSRTALLAEQGKDLEETLLDLKREQDLADKHKVNIDGPQAATAAAPAPAPPPAAEDDDDDEREPASRLIPFVNGAAR